MPQRRWSWLSKILVRQGHEVTVVAPPAHYLRRVSLREWVLSAFASTRHSESGKSGERIIRTGYFPAGRSLTVRILNQATVALSMFLFRFYMPKDLKGYRPDIIIGTVPALPTSVVTQFLASSFHVPFIIDLRDAWPELLRDSDDWNTGTGKRSFREQIARLGPMQALTVVTEKAMNNALRHADGIITTSERLTEALKQQYRKDQLVVTIRNVFPPKTRFRALQKLRRENSLNVLYAGTLGRAQKLENALKAAKMAQDAGCNLSLRFVGDGAAWEALHEEAERLDVCVEILHRKPADELEEHYRWADTALVHLTDWEPLTRAVPSKTYELMALGIHISASIAGETAELIEELEAGDVVDPESPEKLADLWMDLAAHPTRLHVSNRGARWVEHQRDVIVPRVLIDAVERIGGAS